MQHKIKLKTTIRISNSNPTIAMTAQIACIPPILKSQDQISNNLQRTTMDTMGTKREKLGREPVLTVAQRQWM